MTNIDAMNAELKKREDDNLELAKKAFEDAGTLTEEEVEQLEEIRSEVHTTVVTEDALGHRAEQSVEQFVGGLDENVATTKSDPPVKLMDSMDIPDVIAMKSNISNTVKSRAVEAIQAISAADVTVDDFDALSEKAMAALRKMFNSDTLDSIALTKKLTKMPLSWIVERLPEEIVHTFCSDEDLKYHQAKAKEQLIASLAYLVVTGPELDDMNEYIDHEHKKMSVITRIAQCNIEMDKVINSKETLTEIVDKAIKARTAQAADYAEVIKLPDSVSSFFFEYAMVSDKMAEAYENLLSEYEDEADRKLIQEEVDISRKKAEVYRFIENLELFEDRLHVYEASTKTDKRFTASYMERQAIDVIDRVRGAKISVAFPGYTGEEGNSKEIYYNYLHIFAGDPKTGIKGVVTEYNEAIEMLREKGKDVSDLAPITHDPAQFAQILLIVMGRITKYLARNTATKYDAILLDAYFMMLCRISSDIFVINKINKMVSPFLDYVKTLPEKKTKK